MEQQNNMMPNGPPGQGNQSMQRPQSGNYNQQVHARIMESLKNSLQQFQGGWQAMFDIRERAARILQLVTLLRTINQGQNVASVLNIALNFELRTLQSAPNKEAYNLQMGNKMKEITMRRQQQATNMDFPQAGGMPQGVPMNAQNGMMNMQNIQSMQNMQNTGMGNMGFPNGGNMGMTPGNPMQNQQMFNAQLQRPMQASPLNMPQQPPTTLDPSALQLPPQQQQNQPRQQPNMGQPNQPQGMNVGQGQGQGQPSQQEVFALAKVMFDRTPQAQQQQIRARLISQMTEEQKAQNKVDPLMRMCVTQAQKQLAQRRQMEASGGQQNKPGMQNGGNMGGQMGANPPQRPPSQASGQNIDFSGILGQQANALKLQESGEQVVPASNNNNNNSNNMGMGSQVNMPQSINPQMLGNNNSNGTQGGQNQNQANFNFMMQQNAQQRERMQKQMMAQSHAMQSRNQLQGQPGGLHTPNGGNVAPQVNSPANMSMLNRPMVPPGNATPSTPQPNRQQQPTPSTPMNNGVSQLAQHHQNMVNQNNQQQQSQQNNSQMNPQMNAQMNMQMEAMLSRVPEQYRQKLRSMPPEQMQQFLNKFKSSMQAGRPPGQAGQQGQQGQPGQQNGMPNMNMGGQQQGNQQMQNMMQQQQMANAIPGFNSQPPPNQMQGDPNQMQRAQQQARFRAQAMDMSPFPKPVLTQLGLSVPPNVQSWGQLKQHVQQNAAPGTVEKLQQQQAMFFQSRPQDLQNAMHNLMQHRQRMQQQAQMAQNGQMGQMPQLGQMGQPAQQQMQTPVSQPAASMAAPQPQMVAPTAPMTQTQSQDQPRMPNMAPPSAQEINVFRSKVPQAQTMTDEAIRQFILKSKLERFKAMANQRSSLQNAQQQRPTNQANENTQAAQRTPQTASGQPAVGQTGQKGQQSSNNDVIEISSQPAPQAPPMQSSQSQNRPQSQQPSRPTQEELAKIQRRTQNAQIENLRKAQGQMGAQSNQVMPGQGNRQAPNQEKINSMVNEVMQSMPKGPAVNIDAAGLEQCKALLKKLWMPLKQLSTTFPIAIAYGFEDQRLKEIMKARYLVQQNALDGEGNIRDYLSVTPQTLGSIERMVAQFMTDLKNKRDSLQAAAAKQDGAQAQTTQAPQAPAMASNNSQQNHVRKASASTNKVPAAPTEKKTFDWTPTPSGVPKYGSQGLTQDNLKIPAQKRRKTDQPNSQGSTPAVPGATSSPAPASGKGQVSEVNRKTQAQLKQDAEKEAESRKFRCKDTSCEASLKGFDTEAQLKQHGQTQHQPVEDPLQYLLTNAEAAMGVGKAGNAKPKPQTAPTKPSMTTQGKTRVATVHDLKQQDLTKAEADQLRRGFTPASVKDKIAKKQTEFDAEKGRSPKEPSLRDAMAQKFGIPIPEEPVDEPKVEDATMDDAFDPILPSSDEDQWIDLEKYEAVDWDAGHFQLRKEYQDFSDSSPELTPNGSDSSRDSDVSPNDSMKFMVSMENMDADLWGDGSGGGVPESLVPIYHQLKDFDFSKESWEYDPDAVMSDGDNKEGGSPKKRKAEDDLWEMPIDDLFNGFFSQPENQPLI